ncbi:alpha/beta fold hydrolase [Sphingomonas sp. ASY06-1R]|uniref:alpha/beta fold hydrolase n=1 Tax=Sphingomonas sp. ASY06-1R TaxID=3445771 RepID=UPI003FA1D540
MKLLFLHGWGFDARLWDGVRQALAPLATIAWDRGYFERPQAEPVDGPLIAIGHSLGSLILSCAPPPGCIGLIAINGFDRFAGDGAVPRRVVDRMRHRFADAPGEVLDAFRIRSGAAPAEDPIDAARLAADLDLLATGDARDGERPRLILHGGDDPILPPEMRATLFGGAPAQTLAGAAHLLPLTHPDWCAAQIRAVLP